VTLRGTALFLAGHALFKAVMSEQPPWAHGVAMLVLAALVPVGLLASALVVHITLELLGGRSESGQKSAAEVVRLGGAAPAQTTC
jgi:hypothetical protein